MTPKELMNPRWKVIAEYPMMAYEKGDIVPAYENGVAYIIQSDDYSAKYSMKDFPELFKRLEWWEERAEEDMPLYLKFSEDRNVISSEGGEQEPDYHVVKKQMRQSDHSDWRNRNIRCFVSKWHNKSYCYGAFIPITAEEYHLWKFKTENK